MYQLVPEIVQGIKGDVELTDSNHWGRPSRRKKKKKKKKPLKDRPSYCREKVKEMPNKF